MDRVVIVGASLAGVHAAEALREFGFTGEVTLVGGEGHLPYDRQPLSKTALVSGPHLGDLLLRDPDWYAAHAITLKIGSPAVGLDTTERVVAIAAGEEIPYDGLVIATGSRARQHVPFSRDIVHLRSIEDAQFLADRLPSVRHVVVVGAGFLGLELVATVRSMGLEASVVEIGPQPLNRVLGDELGGWVRDNHVRHGVAVHCGRYVASIERLADAGGTDTRPAYEVTLDDETTMAADLVVAGVGAEPNVDWLAGSGVQVGDGVRCDASLATTVPGIVAAGDVARWYNPLFDEEMRIEQWTNAIEQSRHAARTLLGAPRPYAAVPYLWSDQYDARMRFVGRANAADQIRVERADARSLVAVLGRDGVLTGALCVNAPRELAGFRAAIAERRPFC